MRLGALVLLLGTASPALVWAQVPAGGEFQVNTYTTDRQSGPAVASDARGNFVVVWQERRATGYGNFARRYDATGLPLGVEFQVTTALSPMYFGPRMASEPGGRFIVAWLFDGPTSTDMWRVRRFGVDGAPVGPVLSGTYLRSRSPDVAIDGAGNFVVAWSELGFSYSGRDILVQRFDAAGASLGAAFQANTYTTFDQRTARVAMDAGGNFVVVWTSNAQDGAADGVFGQRFSASGAAVGGEFQVNSYTTGSENYASVAAAADGRFIVSWTSTSQEGSGTAVFAQRFSASGSPQGAEMQVNTYTTSNQYGASLAADAAGNFVVTWQSSSQDGSAFGIFGQRFDAAGARRGAEFRLNSTTAGSQSGPSLTSDPQGNLVVAWTSENQDGSGLGVFAQRFGGLVPAALAVDTARNGVFEPGESVDVRPSWRNVNGAAQTFGGTAVGFTGPAPGTYTIVDGAADYGSVANGGSAQCTDCYSVAIPTTTRPVLHWDAVLEERITPDPLGQDKLWRVHLGASFTDVAASSPFYPFVETLLHHAVTGGCGAAQYCPGGPAAREQMAVFVLVAKEGAGYRPPACGPVPMFPDVPVTSPFCPFVEELARRGVVTGCGGGDYCPAAAVTREQMPVFVLRTLDPAIDPPPCGTPLFTDVPASSPYCRWIEELTRRGVVTGCGGGNYCPADPVTREQMAVFIAATFGLALYAP